MVEGVGFEPTKTFALPVFKTGAFNRSATPPIHGNKRREMGKIYTPFASTQRIFAL